MPVEFVDHLAANVSIKDTAAMRALLQQQCAPIDDHIAGKFAYRHQQAGEPHIGTEEPQGQRYGIANDGHKTEEREETAIAGYARLPFLHRGLLDAEVFLYPFPFAEMTYIIGCHAPDGVAQGGDGDAQHRVAPLYKGCRPERPLTRTAPRWPIGSWPAAVPQYPHSIQSMAQGRSKRGKMANESDNSLENWQQCLSG
jgi:hypothetical protein